MQKRRKSRVVLAAGVLALMAVSARSVDAGIITVDPDAFASGTIITNSFSGITLQRGGLNVDATSDVYSIDDPLASTGDRSFGLFTQSNGLIRPGLWRSVVFDLGVNFDTATDFVSIDFLPDSDLDGGRLFVTDSVGNLLEEKFSLAGAAGVPFTLSISRPTADIERMTATGAAFKNIGLDNLRYNDVTAVPEPATLALFGVGLAGIGFLRRRRPN